MTNITVKLSAKEVDLLTTLAADQLFHIEFIDARMAGHKIDSAELSLGKKLVERLRLIADRAKGVPIPKRNGAAA